MVLFQTNDYLRSLNYSEVPIIRPPMVVVENGLNSDLVTLMRPIYIEKCILILKQVVLV